MVPAKLIKRRGQVVPFANSAQFTIGSGASVLPVTNETFSTVALGPLMPFFIEQIAFNPMPVGVAAANDVPDVVRYNDTSVNWAVSVTIKRTSDGFAFFNRRVQIGAISPNGAGGMYSLPVPFVLMPNDRFIISGTWAETTLPPNQFNNLWATFIGYLVYP